MGNDSGTSKFNRNRGKIRHTREVAIIYNVSEAEANSIRGTRQGRSKQQASTTTTFDEEDERSRLKG